MRRARSPASSSARRAASAASTRRAWATPIWCLMYARCTQSSKRRCATPARPVPAR
ncbi:hypothetical protein L914_00579 [Phytophthora nicotianae]|uniref:Uncharacterized protein n=1 Tax=Phytophthora nicotianae TaxID=4792 RepID=W2P652_PHYNI|nr:hypothetical protein L914_00579 [Phytophthora nicotianae]